MNDISGISTCRLITQPKVSLESVQPNLTTETTQEIHEMRAFEIEMEQINHAFALMKEIRGSLESALKNLTPDA